MIDLSQHAKRFIVIYKVVPELKKSSRQCTVQVLPEMAPYSVNDLKSQRGEFVKKKHAHIRPEPSGLLFITANRSVHVLLQFRSSRGQAKDKVLRRRQKVMRIEWTADWEAAAM